jgi:hypothetical protein
MTYGYLYGMYCRLDDCGRADWQLEPAGPIRRIKRLHLLLQQMSCSYSILIKCSSSFF